jgi:hypothetical protein
MRPKINGMHQRVKTRSARESSSWPRREDLPLHRATLPSRKSASNPAGRNASAFHIYV